MACPVPRAISLDLRTLRRRQQQPSIDPTCNHEQADERTAFLHAEASQCHTMNTLKAKISLHYRRIFSSYRVVNLFLGYEKVTDPVNGSAGQYSASHCREPGSSPGHSSAHEICGKVTLRGVFSASSSVSPFSIMPPTLHTHLHLHSAIPRRTSGDSPGTFEKSVLFRKSGSTVQENSLARNQFMQQINNRHS